MSKSRKMEVLSREVTVRTVNAEDYICIADIGRYKDAERTDDLIRNWIRNRNTIEFLGIWEQINNPEFKPVEFDGFRKQAGLNSFTMTPKQWIERTGAIGIVSKAGRYGDTYAHEVMALHIDFPDSPHAILNPDIRWFPADEALRETSPDEIQ